MNVFEAVQAVLSHVAALGTGFVLGIIVSAWAEHRHAARMREAKLYRPRRYANHGAE